MSQGPAALTGQVLEVAIVNGGGPLVIMSYSRLAEVELTRGV